MSLDRFKKRILEIEKAILIHSLEQTGWNVSEAARSLGLERTTLVEKARRYGIKKPSASPVLESAPSPGEPALELPGSTNPQSSPHPNQK